MKKARSKQPDELRSEYDLGTLKHPVRGKYHARAIAGSNVVLLDADVAEVFPTAESVNDALRLLASIEFEVLTFVQPENASRAHEPAIVEPAHYRGKSLGT